MEIILKIMNQSIRWTSNSTIGHIPWQNHNSKRYMYPDVHCCTIYNSQDMEATEVPTDRWMDKEVVVHIHNGLLLRHKEQRMWVSCSEVDEPRTCYTEWSQSEREEQILYSNTCIWNLEKQYWRTYLQKRNGDADPEDDLWTQQRKRAGLTEKEALTYNIHNHVSSS